MVLRTVGDAEAGKIRAIGTADADVIRLKIESMDSDNYAMVQVAQALSANKIPLVPQILVNGGGTNGGSGSLVDVLMANMVRDNMVQTKTVEIAEPTKADAQTQPKSDRPEKAKK